MVKELFNSVATHLEDRMTNPILGTFSLSWIFINWKVFLILLFSQKNIEEKISFIEAEYASLEFMLFYPITFTCLYLLVTPWALLGVQFLQEKANGQRKSHKLKADTDYLSAKIEFVRAESTLDAIRLEQELKRDMEIKNNDMGLEREKAKHEFDIERERRRMDFEYEERKAEYEERRQSKENEMNHEKSMRELKIEEKRRRDQIELEKYKADSVRYKN